MIKKRPARTRAGTRADRDPESRQDRLANRVVRTDGPDIDYTIRLLFHRKPGFPTRDALEDVMRKALGTLSFVRDDPDLRSFYALDKTSALPEGLVPMRYSVRGPLKFEAKKLLEEGGRPEGTFPEEYPFLQMAAVKECRWMIEASDYVTGSFLPGDRAWAINAFVDALMELFPGFLAVHIPSAWKTMTSARLRESPSGKYGKFLHYAVSFRKYGSGIPGSTVVDSIGMNVVSCPDVQYTFHHINAENVQAHASDVLSQMLFRDPVPLEFPGLRPDGKLDRKSRWTLEPLPSPASLPERRIMRMEMGAFSHIG